MEAFFHINSNIPVFGYLSLKQVEHTRERELVYGFTYPSSQPLICQITIRSSYSAFVLMFFSLET